VTAPDKWPIKGHMMFNPTECAHMEIGKVILILLYFINSSLK